jgi:hypothetical protein
LDGLQSTQCFARKEKKEIRGKEKRGLEREISKNLSGELVPQLSLLDSGFRGLNPVSSCEFLRAVQGTKRQ